MNGRMRLLCLVVLCGLIAVGFYGPSPAVADASLERIGDHGLVDWIGRRVSATGIGVARKGDSPAKGRVLAERASLTVARRNLLEAIRGVHIDSRTTVNKFMVADDTIVAKVAGVLQYSAIDRVERLSDGSVQTTVSMPLTGSLGAVLIEAAAGGGPNGALLQQLQRLEERVRTLEEKIDAMDSAALRQQEVMAMLRRFVAAWTAYTAARPLIAAQANEPAPELLSRLRRNEARIEEVARRLDELARRLDAPAQARAAAPKKAASPYTGLVVDARGIGFRPCLRPEIYGSGALLYPAASADLQKAVRNGYVRYYRRIDQAEQSERVGSLPLTVRARATYGGDRGLEIESKWVERIKAAADDPEGFIANCQVVIVF